MVNVQWSMVNEVRERFAPEGQVAININPLLLVWGLSLIFRRLKIPEHIKNPSSDKS